MLRSPACGTLPVCVKPSDFHSSMEGVLLTNTSTVSSPPATHETHQIKEHGSISNLLGQPKELFGHEPAQTTTAVLGLDNESSVADMAASPREIGLDIEGANNLQR